MLAKYKHNSNNNINEYLGSSASPGVTTYKTYDNVYLRKILINH